MNIMNMAMKYVGPVVVDRIAAKLGIGGPVVNKLIAAALPSILGSVIGKSNSSSGLSSIMGMITGADKPQANALADMFDSDGDVDALTKSGGGMLEGLLGGGGLSALTGALGRDAGVDESQANSIVGMLAPVALGTIGGQVEEQGLDGPGLATFLQGQAGNVAQAMPSGFASQLDGSGLFDGLQANLAGGVGAATAAAGAATAAVGGAAASAADTVQDGAKKSRGILPWIIGLVILGLIAWYFLGRGGTPEVDTSAVTSAMEFKVGDVNVGEEFGSITGSLTETFQGITNAETAQAALPQLGELTTKIGTLQETAGGLTGEAKSGFQGVVAAALGQIRPIIEGAISSSGAESILQPIADQILGALEGMAG